MFMNFSNRNSLTQAALKFTNKYNFQIFTMKDNEEKLNKDDEIAKTTDIFRDTPIRYLGRLHNASVSKIMTHFYF